MSGRVGQPVPEPRRIPEERRRRADTAQQRNALRDEARASWELMHGDTPMYPPLSAYEYAGRPERKGCGPKVVASMLLLVCLPVLVRLLA